MRKLMLIAATAFMMSTPCYANLSLANAETSPTAIEHPNTEMEARQVKTASSPSGVSRRRQHRWTASRFSNRYYVGYGFFHGGNNFFRGGC
jgi:hypothetical protein